jgi:GntR family transcriptional regulator
MEETKQDLPQELDISINKYSGLPLYLQLANELKRLIIEGKLDNFKITEGLLEKKLKISRNTIRQAIATLSKQGLVVSQRSKGIIIVEQSSETIQETTLGLSFTEAAIKMGKKSTVKGLLSEVISPPVYVKRAIPEIDKKEKVFHTKRLRCLEEKPICIVDHYIPIKFVPGISEKDFAESGPMQSFHYILETKYNIKILKWQESIMAGEATKEDAEILNVQENSPLLLRRDCTFSTEGKIIYCSIHKFISKYEISGITIFKERL